ncbi:MAG: YhbY family RNA-binding protein [Candidatus Pacearchaeota archaeon]|jgi:RNA-binding protein YhbY
MKTTILNIQLGKNGITENFINTLKLNFKNHRNIKISVLANLTRDKKEIKKLSEEILEKLGKNFTTRIIGFTIVVKKWRRARL